MGGYLVKPRHKVKKGENTPLAQRVQDLIHARDGQLAKSANVVELLVVDSDPSTARCFRDDHQGARVWRSRVLDQTGSQVLIEGGVHLFSQIGLMRCGREVTGALPPGTEISKGIREQEPKSVLELEKTTGNSQRSSPSSSMAAGVYSGLCKSKVFSRRCLGRPCQTLRRPMSFRSRALQALRQSPRPRRHV